jgi:hypothetical protein
MASDITLGLLVGLHRDPAPPAVIDSLTQAQITVSARDKSAFDLNFAVSKSSPIVTQLLPSGYFDPPTRIIITVTFRGVKIVLMDGVITAQEMVPSDEAGKSVLSIKGEDLTRMLDLVDLSGFPFPCMSPEMRIALMLAKYTVPYGIVPVVIPSILFEVPNPLVKIPGQRGTDLTYIRRLAKMAGYTFFIQPGPVPGVNLAYWGPMLRAQIPFLPRPNPIAINWDGRSNVESLQFGFDGFAKTQWVVLIQMGALPVPIPIPVPPINPISPPLGQKSPMPLAISPMPGLAKYTPVQAAAIALGRAAEDANIVRGQGTLDVMRYGSILPARSLVEVRGAGITYDGKYFVESTTHTIKPGSYKQSFTLTRNALIAGTGSLTDALSYGLSPVRTLSSFAKSVSERVPVGPFNIPLPPGPKLPAPPDPLSLNPDPSMTAIGPSVSLSKIPDPSTTDIGSNLTEGRIVPLAGTV